MIKGLFETHIRVSNLERSIDFYQNTLELEFAHLDSARRVAFFWIGEPNQYMLGLWEHPAEEIFRQHFAFRIDLEDMDKAVDWLKTRNLKPRNFFNDGTQRPMIFGWMPAIAIYFRDPDGHSLEFIAPLPEEARPDMGIVTQELWEKRNAKA